MVPILTNLLQSFASREPDLRPIPLGESGDFQFYQYSDWTVEFVVKGIRYRLTITEGLISDGTSGGWAKHLGGIERTGLECRGSWAHDGLYINNGDVHKAGWSLEVWNHFNNTWDKSDYVFNRGECDEIFLWLLLDNQVPQERADTMYFFVRRFGWVPWNMRAKSAPQYLIQSPDGFDGEVLERIVMDFEREARK